MNPTTAITVIQGIASKKLMLVMWVIYFITGIAEKQPERALECIYIMAGVTAAFLGCQTVLDWRAGGKKGIDSDDTFVPVVGDLVKQ
jgi:hypothetical protein